jgi:hypothetical protein
MKERITDTLIDNIVSSIPLDWLQAGESAGVYAEFFRKRLAHSDIFTKAIENAR